MNQEPPFSIIFFGSYSGKSTLINRLKTGIYRKMMSTIGVDFVNLNLKLYDERDLKFRIIDAGGHIRSAPMIAKLYSNVEAAIFFFDPTSLFSLEVVEDWKKHFDTNVKKIIPCFIASPKSDLEPSTEIDEDYCQKNGYLKYTKFSNIK
jgi:small GTP-binding protein